MVCTSADSSQAGASSEDTEDVAEERSEETAVDGDVADNMVEEGTDDVDTAGCAATRQPAGFLATGADNQHAWDHFSYSFWVLVRAEGAEAHLFAMLPPFPSPPSLLAPHLPIGRHRQ